MTCNSVKEPNQGLDAVVSILGMNPVPAVIKEEQTLTPPRERRMRANKPPVMFEFCCSKDSRLGEVNASRGFQHFRLCKEFTDLSDPLQIESLSSMIDQFKGADLWGSVPFGPWFQQKLAFNRHGKAYRSKLRKRLQESRTLLKNFLAIAELIILNGGHVCLEWPKLCEGWATKELLVFVKRHNLYETCCDGRALGLGDESWRIVTSSRKLAKDLSSFHCRRLTGLSKSQPNSSRSGKSMLYTNEMAQTISHSLHPELEVPLMPTIPFVQSEHVPKIDRPFVVDAGVHQLIDRKDWFRHPGAQKPLGKKGMAWLQTKFGLVTRSFRKLNFWNQARSTT